MAAIITEKFRQHNADQFYESFSETSANNYYLFIGKTSPFTSTTSGGSDTTPPTPQDTITLNNYKWDSMIAAKRIGTTDVTYVIPRRNYAEGTVYDMYEHNISSSNTSDSGATNLFDSTYYFMTDEYKVYKVLDNNGADSNGITAGATGPTTTQSDPFFEGGYYLQYMYTLSTSQIQKFVTTDFIPVVTNTTVAGDTETSAAPDTAPFNGAPIKVVKVTGGSGYTNGTYYAPIRGDGSGGVVKIHVTGGEIAAFGSLATNTQIEAAGSSYTYGTVDLTNDIFSTYNSGTGALSGATTMGAGTNGVIVPIISPKVGHGHDSIAELGGHYIMLNAKLEQAEGDDFAVGNDFREVGILVDPTTNGGTGVFSGTTARQTYAVAFSSSSATFEPDEKITQATTGAVGRVVEYDTTRKILYYLQEQWENYGVNTSGDHIAFSGSGDIVGATSGSTGVPAQPTPATVTLAGGNTISFDADGYSNPELQPDSGDIIYVENRRPISRASDQTEDIKIVVEF